VFMCSIELSLFLNSASMHLIHIILRFLSLHLVFMLWAAPTSPEDFLMKISNYTNATFCNTPRVLFKYFESAFNTSNLLNKYFESALILIQP
jgi:hypothetical protein